MNVHSPAERSTSRFGPPLACWHAWRREGSWRPSAGFSRLPISTLWFRIRRRSPKPSERHRITTSWIQKLPRASQYYSHYLPLFPFAIEQFDLSGYDLVVSSDAVVSKGVITRPETCHICYCHTPMRYAWSAYHTYLRAIESSWKRKLVPFFMNYLRTWDLAAASRVDYFLANSQTVANRIAKYYRREAHVIFPPVRRFRIFRSAAND